MRAIEDMEAKLIEPAVPAVKASPERREEAELVERIAGGDQSALRDAYDRHAGNVMGVAIGLLRNRELAQDIVQEVFVRLWERPDRYDPQRGGLRAFLQMDAHGRSIDLIRSIRAADERDRADHARTSSATVAGTEELAMDAVTAQTVRGALGQLPEEQSTPIALAFFDGYSYRDVAGRLGLPEGTVKSRIRAGMRRLKLVLSPEAI